MKTKLPLIIVLTLFGLYLRLHNLGLNPFMQDEAFFGMTLRDNIWRQEFIPHFIAYIFNLNSDYSLRLISVLFGTASIPLTYYVLKNFRMTGTLFVALNPLFLFWGQLARPYAVAAFFCILGWRYWWAYIPALATSSISIVTIKMIKQKKWVLLFLLVIAGFTYFIRPDVGNVSLNIMSSRWWYLILISLTLYVCDYVLPFIKSLKPEKIIYIPLIFIFCLIHLHWLDTFYSNETFTAEAMSLLPATDKYLYRSECKFSDWRDCGKLDFATEYNNAAWYGGGHPKYFHNDSQKLIDSMLIKGDTLKVGLGQLSINLCSGFILRCFGRDFFSKDKKYVQRLYFGDVIIVKMWYKGRKINWAEI